MTVYDGKTGISLAKEMSDLIILDIMMPCTDGFEVCRTIQNDVLCPILFLSARQSEADKIKGFNLGGDDYITKPFGLREIIAKIEANLRREKRSQYINAENLRSKLFFGQLTLNIIERTVRIKNEYIPLTKIEYEIVELLALHAGQIFTKEQIYEKVWGYDGIGDNTTVVERIKKFEQNFLLSYQRNSIYLPSGELDIDGTNCERRYLYEKSFFGFSISYYSDIYHFCHHYCFIVYLGYSFTSCR